MTAPDQPTARHLRIHGVVQGVGFRAGTVAEARRLGVTGWVRNRADGSLEGMVQGTPGAVAALIAWARHGPRRAQVTRVEVTEVAVEALATFEWRATA